MNKKKLIDILQENSGIAAALLFGSQASENANQESDIDIALLYNAQCVPDGLELLQYKQDLSDQMEQDVDIVVLNEASPIIAMQTIKHGVPLFLRDKKAYDKFEIKLITDYADIKYLRDPFERNILKRKLYD